jgi:uncharacterized protein (TIGR00730 family)
MTDRRALRRVCVFCGSSSGAHPAYAGAAREVGTTLARESIALVYGGGRTGLMGILADAALAAGGEVIGVIPDHLEQREVAHTGLSDLRVVRSMHERKAVMAELSDAFVGLPGGLGTMEEFFEVTTWNQLRIHAKPAGLLNVRGYYDLVDRFLAHAVDEGFLRAEQRALITVSRDLPALLESLRSQLSRPDATVGQWPDAGQER